MAVILMQIRLGRFLLALIGLTVLFTSESLCQTARFIYVVNELSDSISGFAINEISGDLTAIPESPFPTPHMPHRLAINPSGTYAYLVTEDSKVARLVTYSIDRRNGALTVKANQSLPSPSFAVPIIEVSGQILLLASGRSGDISVYRLDSNSGIPALIGSVRTGTLPWSSTVDPLGKFVFVAGNSSNIAGYALDAQKGEVKPVPGSPFIVRTLSPVAGRAPISEIAVLHPSGNFLYVTDPVHQVVSAFSVDRGNGAVHPLSGSPLSTQGIQPFEAAIEAHGRFLYLGDWHRGVIAVFSIDSSGKLAPVAGSPFSVPFTSTSARSGGTALAIDPSGRFLYASSTESNEVIGLRINPNTGALVPVPTNPISTGKHPFRITITP